MTIKDSITPQLKDRFRKEIQNTIKEGIEYGFNLCLDKKGKLFGTETCKGDECGIVLKNITCPPDSKYQGNFHTHPDIEDVKELFDKDTPQEYMISYIKDVARKEAITLTIPSNIDVLDAIKNRCKSKINGTVCIGSDLEDNKIECWTVKKNISKIDCLKTDIRGKFSFSMGPAEKWTKNYFDIEYIDL